MKDAQIAGWSAYYCDYDLLKRRIDRCAAAAAAGAAIPSSSRSLPVRAKRAEDDEAAFAEALELVLQKVHLHPVRSRN